VETLISTERYSLRVGGFPACPGRDKMLVEIEITPRPAVPSGTECDCRHETPFVYPFCFFTSFRPWRDGGTRCDFFLPTFCPWRDRWISICCRKTSFSPHLL